jgi:protein-tyrosine phosphatase
VDVLVSALTSVEERDLDLLQEERLAGEVGLRFVRLRTDDLAVPDFDTASAVLDELAAEVRVGRGVAVHCRMGVGRSPLIAAGLLVALGCQPDEAWQRVERARAVRVPDTEAQREWIATYARWRGAGHL